MKPVTLDGLDHYVWEFEPDWGAGFTTIFRLEADQVASLTKRERRSSYGETLRIEVQANYMLSGAEAAEARNALRTLQDIPVRLPFLPAIDDAGALFNSRWYLAFDYADGPGNIGSVQNLYWTNVANDYNGRTHIFPTLLGYLLEPPKFSMANTEQLSVPLRWQESSGFAEALQFVDGDPFTEGPAIGARTIYQFPFVPDFDANEDSGPVVVQVTRQNVGFSRDFASAAYPQLGSRQPEFEYTLPAFDVARLLQFFLARRGPTEAFWIPCWVGECRLAADAVAADVTVTVTDATALGDQRYIQFFGPNDEIIQRHVTLIAGNVLTLDSAIGVDLPADSTVFCTLALVRFASAQLTITWESPIIAKCRIQFAEVSQEYATPLGEVYGGTIGALPATAYLYQLNSGLETWYWTSYEKDLTYGGNDYVSSPIEHDEITDGMAWESNSCQVKFRSAANHPLLRLIYRTATDRLEFIIAKVVPGAPATNYAVIFRGWITGATFEGAWITAKADSFGTLFSRNVPRTIIQQGDNFALFDAGNRLVRANWTFTARLTAVAGNVLTFDTLTWPPGALPAIGANYFALGQIERPTNVERIPVVASTAIAGGVVTLTLQHGFMELAPAPPENGWLLTPGYDGLYDTAVNKFSNGVNFGGFPFVPDVNPSLIQLANNLTGGSKKS